MDLFHFGSEDKANNPRTFLPKTLLVLGAFLNWTLYFTASEEFIIVRSSCGLELLMANRIITTLVDDIDGTLIAEGEGGTVLFALDRVTYEVDLTSSHAVTLRDALAPFIAAGRVVGKSGTKVTPRSGTSNRAAELAEIRAWARANGLSAPDRGRMPAQLLAAFEASKR
jgi:hypothetical protein